MYVSFNLHKPRLEYESMTFMTMVIGVAVVGLCKLSVGLLSVSIDI